MPIYKTGKSKDGKTQYRVTHNYTDSNGNYKQTSKLVYGLPEAKQAEITLMHKTRETPNNITIQTLYDEYTLAKSHEVRESSLHKIKSVLSNNVLLYLSKVKLDKLNSHVLQNWKNEISKADTKVTTKQNVYKEFRAMLNFAVKMDYLQTNPLLKVGNFKDAYDLNKSEEKIQYYTSEEFKKFISVIPDEDFSYFVFFNIAFYTGLRKGENNALDWNSLNGNLLKVTRSVTQKIKGKESVFTPPKNASSYRTLQLPKQLVSVLEEQKKRQQKNSQKWNTGFLICGGAKCLSDTAISNKNIQYAKAAGLHHIRIHDFRHTHATLLINEGINIQEIARRLGHADVNITWKTYSHLYPREEERAIKVLENI